MIVSSQFEDAVNELARLRVAKRAIDARFDVVNAAYRAIERDRSALNTRIDAAETEVKRLASIEALSWAQRIEVAAVQTEDAAAAAARQVRVRDTETDGGIAIGGQ